MVNEQVDGIGPPTSKLASGRKSEALQEKDAVELSVRTLGHAKRP